jgi:hypothetical protein
LEGETMKVEIVICDLCEGDWKLATASYVDACGDEWDICKDCEEIVRKEGFLCRSISQSEEAKELLEARAKATA